ncbi:MAG: DUF937 domain-containing protein [Gammaproteobacteria bacterium]|nr:DUF937 domain-containing protein [Gammaproteobacteria bacterium]
MDLMKLGTDLLMQKLNVDADGDGNPDGIMGALSGLLGGANGNLDLGALASKMNAGGLQDILGSWLGDGENQAISTDQIRDLFGGDKVAEFASKLNISENDAATSLADAVPQMVDKGSSGGSLLDSVGGLGGVMDMAKKFL